MNLVNYCILKKIPHLSVYALSTENYNRGKINIIFNLINSNKKEFLEKVKSQNLCFPVPACDKIINPIQFGRKIDA